MRPGDEQVSVIRLEMGFDLEVNILHTLWTVNALFLVFAQGQGRQNTSAFPQRGGDQGVRGPPVDEPHESHTPVGQTARMLGRRKW